MSNSYLKFGYFVTWLLIALAIPAGLLIMYLLIGHIAGFVSPGEWISISDGGSFTIFLSDDNATGNDIPAWSLNFILIKALVIVGLWTYILWLIKTVISSVENLKTFQTDNIVAFRKMGWTFIVLMAISSFAISTGNDTATVSLSISFSYLALAAGAFLISEVFREGHELYEQNRLMI